MKKPFLRIILYMMIMVGSQILASLVVGVLCCGGDLQSMSLAEADNAMLEAIYANQTLLLLISYGIVVLVLCLLALKNRISLIQYTGLHRKSTGKPIVLAMLLGLASCFWVSFAVALAPWPEAWISDYSQASSVLTTSSPLLDAAATVLFGPIIEEVLFRGLIYDTLLTVTPAGVAVVMQAILFGGVHSGPIWMIYAFVVGCALGYVRKRTGSLWPCLGMHIAFNGSSYLFGLFAQQLGSNGMVIVLAFLGSAAAVIALLFALQRCTTPDAPPAA